MALKSGDILNGYRILECESAHSLVSIYRVEHVQTGYVYRIRTYFEDSDTTDSFRFEFPLLAEKFKELDHPYIERVLDYGELIRGVYLVVDTDGITTLAKAFSLPVPEKESINLLAQIAEAIEYLHSKGIHHGDLDLSKILLDEKGCIRVAEYGLSDLLRNEIKWSIPDSFYLMGVRSLSSKSPEQIEGLSSNTKADIFALGTIFFTLITGVIPFGSDGPIESILLRKNWPIGWSPRNISGISKNTIRFIQRCVARNPEDRFKNVGEALKVLIRIRDQKVILLPVKNDLMKEVPQNKFHALLILIPLILMITFFIWGYSGNDNSIIAEILPASRQFTLTIPESINAAFIVTPSPQTLPTSTIIPTSKPAPTMTTCPTRQVTIGVENVNDLQYVRQINLRQYFVPSRMSEVEVSKHPILAVLQFSPDGKQIAASGLAYKTALLQTSDFSDPTIIDGRVPPGYAFSSNGRYLVTVVQTTIPITTKHKEVTGEYLRLSTLPNGLTPKFLGLYTKDNMVFFTPDSKLIVMSQNNQTTTWDVSTALEVETNNGGELGCQVNRVRHNQEFISAFSPAGFLFEWDPLSEYICSLRRTDAVISTDRTLMAYINVNGLLQIDDLVTKEMLWRTQTDGRLFNFSSNNAVLVSGNGNGTVTIWDSATGMKLLEMKETLGNVQVVKFSPDNRYIAVMNSEYTIFLFAVFSNKQ